ncbi:hypothetical protein BT96DRAFT_942956 [Gymnopus androsaceus JB14]|uniref:Uncharacterized protein n=1 Tax=Gymnopus androsaceus JB14 TaxID=1447944 RepID=A0A6A4HBT8_9AGAR|nr:hypothetical protein BT96DRAFT_942956 [Gymnopus androsaceus JB14]
MANPPRFSYGKGSTSCTSKDKSIWLAEGKNSLDDNDDSEDEEHEMDDYNELENFDEFGELPNDNYLEGEILRQLSNAQAFSLTWTWVGGNVDKLRGWRTMAFYVCGGVGNKRDDGEIFCGWIDAMQKSNLNTGYTEERAESARMVAAVEGVQVEDCLLLVCMHWLKTSEDIDEGGITARNWTETWNWSLDSFGAV